MIVEPEQRVEDFAKAGADIISVHCEAETKGNGMERFFGAGGKPQQILGDFSLGILRCTSEQTLQMQDLFL